MTTIAIATRIEKSVFHTGTHTTCLNLYTALENAGFMPTLLNISDVPWFAHINSLKDSYKTIQLKDVTTKFDVLIEVGWHANCEMRLQLAKRTIVFVTYPALFHDIECSAYPHRGLAELIREHPEEPMTWDGVESVWMWNFCSSADKQYLELLSSKPVYAVPFIWYPNIIEAFCKENACPNAAKWETNQQPMIHICENNKSTSSSCIVPIAIVRALRDMDVKPWSNAHIMIHESETLKQRDFFRDNIMNNMRLNEPQFTFMGRKVFATLTDHNAVMLMHQRFRPMRAAILDALWLGIPVVHNSQINEGYTYTDNSISSALDAFNKIQSDLENHTGYFAPDASDKRHNMITKTYSENHEFFKRLLAEPLGNPLRIWFEDFWAGFQPDYNFFTLLLTSRGKSWVLDEHNPAFVFVGPYTDNHKRFPRFEDGGPVKIMFTGENTRPQKDMNFNIGFDYRPHDSTYLRLPLWIIEINWFGCDPERVVNPKPFPLERITDVYPDEIAGRHLFCGFVVSNPNNPLRNEAFHRLSTYKPVASGGALFNNIGHKLEGGPGGGGGELTKLNFFKQCKFALVFENSEHPGYVTEKLLHAKAAGCIPIYWGDPEVAKDFNPEAFVDARTLLGSGPEPNWNALIAEVKHIDTNAHKWLQMYNTPLFYPDTIQRVEKIMTTLLNMFSITPPTASTSSAVDPWVPVEVIPRVWLGCARLAADDNVMKSLGITHTVNCIAGEGFSSLSTLKSLQFDSQDMEGYPILDIHYKNVKQFIDDALESQEARVFVHCRAGINRSGALVVAYASEKTGENPQKIIDKINKVRPLILTNNSFREQVLQRFNKKFVPVQLMVHRTGPTTNFKRKIILTAVTAAYVPCVTLLLRGLAEAEPDAYVRVYAIDKLDVEQRQIITASHPNVSIHEFGTLDSTYFDDYLAPGHYAWKLCLINNEIMRLRSKTEGRSLVLYLDSGMVPVKSDLSSIWKIIDSTGCLFINDETQTNRTWCHPTFCKKLATTEPELSANQLWAGILGIATDSEYVENVFYRAHQLSKDRDIIVGAKWEPYNETCKGHRHDQSILSILTQRAGAPRQPIDMFYSDRSFEDARAVGSFFYVHRGKFVKCLQFSKSVGQVYVIVGNSLSTFKTHARNLENVYSFGAYDPSVPLASDMRKNFNGLDDAAIMRIIAHRELWQRLASSDCNSYCIIEDVCTLTTNWREILSEPFTGDIVLLESQGRAYIITRSAATKLVAEPITKSLPEIFGDVPYLAGFADTPNSTLTMSNPTKPQWKDIDTENIVPEVAETKPQTETKTPNDEYVELHNRISDVWELLAACLEKQLNVHACAIFEKLCETWDETWFRRTDALAVSAQIARLLSGKSIRATDTFMKDLSIHICKVKERIIANRTAWMSVFNAMALPEQEKTYIVYSGQRESVLEWEYDWMCELMPELAKAIWIQDKNLVAIENDMIFIVAGYMPDMWNLIRRASNEGKTFTLIHTSDEWERDPTREIYTLPGCKHVLRNYWRSDLDDLKHVYQIPLGYKRGLKTNAQSKREYTWSFVGDPNKSGRQEALTLLSEVRPHFIHRTAGWKAQNCLNIKEYQTILEKSVFAPCMQGNWNVDCFRIWEALECGAIPIVLSPTKNQPADYFGGLLGKSHPLIIVSNWEESVVLMESMITQPLQLAAYQTRLFSWWKEYKENLKKTLSQLF